MADSWDILQTGEEQFYSHTYSVSVRDILPSFLIEELRDHYYARVGQAEVGFRYAHSDEDSLTGALGQALLMPQRLLVGPKGEQFVCSTTYQKVRGRGPGAPEKRYGIDGIFELAVQDTLTGLTRRKGLLFQAKKGWHTVDPRLLQQTRIMRQLETDSVVIDFAEGDYRAFDAGDVEEAGGGRASIPTNRHYRLAEVLGDQFVECTRGMIDLAYDPVGEVVRVPRFMAGRRRGDAQARVDHAVRTNVLPLK